MPSYLATSTGHEALATRQWHPTAGLRSKLETVYDDGSDLVDHFENLYTYDALHRLTSVERSSLAGPAVEVNFEYNAAGQAGAMGTLALNEGVRVSPMESPVRIAPIQLPPGLSRRFRCPRLPPGCPGCCPRLPPPRLPSRS